MLFAAWSPPVSLTTGSAEKSWEILNSLFALGNLSVQFKIVIKNVLLKVFHLFSLTFSDEKSRFIGNAEDSQSRGRGFNPYCCRILYCYFLIKKR